MIYKKETSLDKEKPDFYHHSGWIFKKFINKIIILKIKLKCIIKNW
jgi:hypothetical protein